MKHESIPFTTKEEWLKLRLEDITSTEVSALFGLSPYLTKYELWHNKKNKTLGEINENERMKWGSRLQDAIAKGIGEDNGWPVVPFKSYERFSDLKIGSSFDFCFLNDAGLNILEIKNVDALAFKEGWVVDGDDIQAPLHIEFQVQHQLLVSRAKCAYIGALVGGNHIVLIKREPDQKVFDKIKVVVAEFWKSIEENKEPEPDFKRDSEFIISLLNKAVKEDLTYATEEIDRLASEYQTACLVEKEAEVAKKAAKAKILMQIGEASKVEGDRFTISCGMIDETKVEAFTKKGYRNFKIHFKKEKA